MDLGGMECIIKTIFYTIMGACIVLLIFIAIHFLDILF